MDNLTFQTTITNTTIGEKIHQNCWLLKGVEALWVVSSFRWNVLLPRAPEWTGCPSMYLPGVLGSALPSFRSHCSASVHFLEHRGKIYVFVSSALNVVGPHQVHKYLLNSWMSLYLELMDFIMLDNQASQSSLGVIFNSSHHIQLVSKLCTFYFTNLPGTCPLHCLVLTILCLDLLPSNWSNWSLSSVCSLCWSILHTTLLPIKWI